MHSGSGNVAFPKVRKENIRGRCELRDLEVDVRPAKTAFSGM
jgi:hypothetical protein